MDPWALLNPREAWLTIILIAAIGFGNYVLLRLYSTRGFYYAAIFGGLVNSTAAIADLSRPIRAAGSEGRALGIVVSLILMIAMFARNLAILSILNPSAGWIAAGPILLMAMGAGVLVWRQWRRQVSPPVTLGSPFQIRTIARFGALFLVIQIAASLGERLLGTYGAIAVSMIGGFASSASTTAAVATLAVHGKITPNLAAIATVATSAASTAANLLILYRETRDKALLRDLAWVSASIIALGVAGLFGIEYLGVRSR
ncbi:MAG: DUF4010 domain-containing protein [Acidobacteriota bacterium]